MYVQMVPPEQQFDPLFQGNQARKLRQFRSEAPADHHRYLLHLTVYMLDRGLRAEDVLPMYCEEFDL